MAIRARFGRLREAFRWLRTGEELMVEMLDPAALGGLAGLIAMAGWSIGRLQGRSRDEDTAEASDLRAIATEHRANQSVQSAIPAPGAAAAAPAPCQQRAREERRALLARTISLAELHDEARAIRKDAGILRDIAADEELVLSPQRAVYGSLPLSRAQRPADLSRCACRVMQGQRGLRPGPACAGGHPASARCGLAVLDPGVRHEILKEHRAGEEPKETIDRAHHVEPANLARLKPLGDERVRAVDIFGVAGALDIDRVA